MLKHTAIAKLAETRAIDNIADSIDTRPETVRRIHRKVTDERLQEMGDD